MNELAYTLALIRFRPFGPIRMKRLREGFASFKDAFESNARDLEIAGIDQAVAEKFVRERHTIDPARELTLLTQHKLNAITILDETYPSLLREIHDPPAVLFYRGVLPQPHQKLLAVVGARRVTTYGERATKKLVTPIARHGVIIVSGLAYGIDAAAHQATLETDGATIAVLASGLDEASIAPAGHEALAERIVENGGCLMTEYPIGV